jgi:hypothetical protein
MRTTIRLDDALQRKAKARAVELGVSLNDFISDAVRAAVQRRGAAAERRDIPTFAGNGLLPGADIDDTSALLDLMEGRAAYAAARAPKVIRVAEQAHRPATPSSRRRPR